MLRNELGAQGKTTIEIGKGTLAAFLRFVRPLIIHIIDAINLRFRSDTDRLASRYHGHFSVSIYPRAIFRLHLFCRLLDRQGAFVDGEKARTST